MIESMQITNKDGTTYYQINDGNAPVTVFDPTIIRRVDTSRNKSQNHGVNPTRSLKGGMEIHMEGALFDDSSALYIAQRKLFIAAVDGDPSLAPDFTVNYDVKLTLTFTGETEAWYANCVVTEFTNPVRALYPSLTEWALTLFSWTPWFTGVDTATKYYF